MGVNNLLPFATKLRQGNVFTPVCDSVHGECLCLWGLCPGTSLSMGLSRDVSVHGSVQGGGVSVQGGLCPRGVSVQVALCLAVSVWGRGVSVQRDPPPYSYVQAPWSRPPPPPADGYCSGRYASYWNAFLSSNFITIIKMTTWNNFPVADWLLYDRVVIIRSDVTKIFLKKFE